MSAAFKSSELDPVAVLYEEGLLPDQWADAIRSHQWSGEHRLMLAVLDDARRVLRLHPKAGTEAANDQIAARDWVMAHDAGYLGFDGICAELSINREHARAILLSGRSPRCKINYRRVRMLKP